MQNEREALARFAELAISLDELSRKLGEMLGIDFRTNERRITSHLLAAEPRVRIEKRHITLALDVVLNGLAILQREQSAHPA